MDAKHFVSGVISSPQDDRDFTISMACKAMGKEPEKVYPKKINIPYPGKIYDQGNIGACVAYSLKEERLTDEFRQTGKIQEFSEGFHYAERHLSFYEGEGMITRDALRALQHYGSVLYEDFPYIDHYSNLKDIYAPLAEILRNKAKPYRISSYFRLDGEGQNTINNIKEALMDGMLVITCVDVYESFFNTGKDGMVRIPDVNKEKNYGGHCMVTFGTNDDIGATNTLNHWGEGWGDNGWCHLPYDYPIREAWAVSDKIDANLVKLQQVFEDADLVSPWAREYVEEASELGLMLGDGKNFNPQGNFTREQAAIIAVKLYRMLKDK